MSDFTFRKPQRPVTKVFIHCSASDHAKHDNVATMRAWHLERGWSDTGYHIFGRKSGRAELGRPLEKTPAAQAGHNRGSIAVCLHGLKEEKFTAAQIEFLKALCFEINRQYGGAITFHGHREVAAKACPVIDYQSILKLDARGRLGLKKGDIDPDALNGVDLGDLTRRHKPTLRLGDRGVDVKRLQRDLTALGYHVGRIDGKFGKRTRAAVLAFQADNFLIEDGVAGQATYEALDDALIREVSDARANTTLTGLARDGSRIARASIGGQVAGVGLAGGGLLSVIEDSSGAVGRLTESFDLFGDTLTRLGPFIGGAIVIGGIVVILQARKAGRARVEDHRSGKTA